MKDLPKMYHNRIEKNIANNEKVFSTMYDKGDFIEKEDRSILGSKKRTYTVEQKIANIFNSPNYIYKIDVIIVTDSGTFNKRIVGKTKTNLITMDSEYIPINTIRDIYIAK
ncbi:MAG: hypothetical protein ACI31S_05380 [Bacilli bacterium]